MKTIIILTLCLLNATSFSFAAGTRIDSDLSIKGNLFLADNSSLTTANGLLKNKGTWSSGANYSAGDVVQNGGSSYVCITANIGDQPPSAKWSVLAASNLPAGLTTQGNKVQRDFLTYSSSSYTATPLHIKTNLNTDSNTMYRILVEGYNYGNAAPIFSEASGYIYVPTKKILNGATVDHASGVTISQYISSDYFLVIRLDAPSFYYAGFSVSAWFVNGITPPTISAQVISSATNL